ncbi:hypothetical protein EI77_03127 [Prosthecobacter fusiformis]|uniref:Uncharacterized protein n=1 Tax=Prosthecobacter fusiformis TaxID=48464 RepID=A0A4R7RR18_9BACT|nr:hypothetical protein EI77_03127 [Prosthecobacter fusiformis]
MLQGNLPPHRHSHQGASVFKKVLISIVVIAAVGSAALFVKVAVNHDRMRQQLRDETPALIRENLELMDRGS